jgi:hypothetical protein
MAKDLTVFTPGQVPAHLRKNELSSLAKALAGGGGASGKRISVKGGVFRLIVDGKELAAIEERHLDIVVVNAAAKISRTFYAGVYEEGSVKAPDCWSADGDKPDVSAKNPQATTCANCPQNIKGSGQGDSRACRFSQRLAVVLENDMEGDVMQLSLAATSIFGKAEGENRPLQAYARWLAEQGIDPGTLVTTMKFDTRAATPKLFFKPKRWLTDEEYAVCRKQGSSDDALKAVTMTVAQTDGVKDNVTPLKLEGTAPGEEPESEEKAAPTVKKAPVKQTAGAGKAGLADVVSKWDTDD